MKKVIVLFMLSFMVVSIAHPGRTDKNGCHKDKKTGKRHCHAK